MKTVKWLLEDGKTLPLGEIPYGEDVYFACRKSNIEVEITMTCTEVLNLINSNKANLILNMKLDDLVSNIDARYNRVINGWFAFIVAVMCLTIIVVNSYTAIMSNQMMSWEHFFLPIIISGMIVWNRMKILREDSAKAAGALIRSFAPNITKRFNSEMEGKPRSHNVSLEREQPYENNYGNQTYNQGYNDPQPKVTDIGTFQPEDGNPYLKK